MNCLRFSAFACSSFSCNFNALVLFRTCASPPLGVGKEINLNFIIPFLRNARCYTNSICLQFSPCTTICEVF